MKSAYGLLALFVFLKGCTALPALPEHQGESTALTPAVELRVCVLRDNDLDTERAERILAKVSEELAVFGIAVAVPWMRDWQRSSFDHQGLIRDVATRPLEAPCDRLLALVGRDARDFLWGLLLPEILGAVETRTHTKGYAVAETGSLNQLLSLMSPKKIVMHEVLHLVGVRHDDSATVAREHIDTLRQMAVRNRRAGCDFFPTITPKGQILRTRLEVDRRFKIAHHFRQNSTSPLREHKRVCSEPFPGSDPEGLPSSAGLVSGR